MLKRCKFVRVESDRSKMILIHTLGDSDMLQQKNDSGNGDLTGKGTQKAPRDDRSTNVLIGAVTF